MIIIIANFNRLSVIEKIGVVDLNNECLELNIKEPIYVYSLEKLLEELEDNRDEGVLLFSNFPPNNSYSDNRLPQDISYSRSSKLFKDLNSKYKFKAMHFITGASEDKVNDELLQSLFPSIPVTITGRHSLMKDGNGYPSSYFQYIIKKIKDNV